MALKTKNIIFTIIKVAILTLIIFWLIYFVWSLFKSDENNDNTKTENKTKNEQNFENISLENISSVWVAISTNVWMKFQKQNNTDSINSDYIWNFSIDEIMASNSSGMEQILDKNLSFLQEYRSFVKMDYNLAMKNSPDKASTLNNLIKQLEFRFRTSISNVKNLQEQQSALKIEYNSNKKELENIKIKMEKDYNDVALQELREDLQVYYSLKSRETVLTTYLVFIWNMIKNYTAINSYNKIVLDTLINNKDVISKSSYVVIPNSWTKVLDDLWLIVTEDEYKADTKNKQEE